MEVRDFPEFNYLCDLEDCSNEAVESITVCTEPQSCFHFCCEEHREKFFDEL
jgi:hypothetical protein